MFEGYLIILKYVLNVFFNFSLLGQADDKGPCPYSTI